MCGFKNIYSVEIVRVAYLAARRKLKAFPNVHLYHGDSVKILPTILKQLDGPATFWLDAHYMSWWTERNKTMGEEACPILCELDMILATSLGHIILIDDRRVFTSGLYGISEQAILDKFTKDGRYQISYANGSCPDDIIVAKMLPAKNQKS